MSNQQANMTSNKKIIAIQFMTPFIQTAAYGGTHRPVERIVFRARKIVEGKFTDTWETPKEYEGWSARVEGPSVFVRPARSGVPEAEEFEFPRACVAITWDRHDETKAERDKAESETKKAG